MASLSDQGKEDIRGILAEAVEGKKTPGLVFGVTNAEEELCWTYTGTRVLGDASSGAVTPDGVYWICSQAKLILSIAAFQLIEAGKLHLDTPVASIVPELANPVVLDPDRSGTDRLGYRPAEQEMRIRHLLNHSSGMMYRPENGFVPYSTTYGEENPVGQFYDILKGDYPGVPLQHEPGTSFSYGWSGDTLGFIVERVSGQSLEEYYKQHIFSPLRIAASFYLTPELKARLVPLSFRQPDGNIVLWSSFLPPPLPAKVNLHLAGTAIYCSMRDYLTLLRHLLQILAGTATEPILQASSLRTFFQPNLTPGGEKAVKEMTATLGGIGDSWSTALCINTTDVPGKRRKGSGWWYGWAGTYHFIDPETGVAAVLGSQLVPSTDPEVAKLWDRLEGALYAGLTTRCCSVTQITRL